MVGILTFHDTNNFGSLLQTYGLYKKITDLGYECEVIDYQCENIIQREIPKPFTLLQSPKKILLDIFLGTAKRKKYKNLSKFLREKMKVSPRYTKENIKDADDRYDKIIVGSDIVWGLDITGEDYTYFLDFCEESSKKYAFSSSVGNEWGVINQGTISQLLKQFSYIAVREEEAADWIENLIDNRPDVVSDPTMLLTSNEWLKQVAIGDTSKYTKQYVLVYFENSNGDCLRAAKQLAKEKNLSVKYINYGLPQSGVDNIKPKSLEDFLSLIYFANHVVTASYHGMLFSLYFNKQFTYYNRAHKSRMNTLSKKLEVSYRNGGDANIMQLPSVNYCIINKNIDDYRMKSICVLKKILSM